MEEAERDKVMLDMAKDVGSLGTAVENIGTIAGELKDWNVRQNDNAAKVVEKALEREEKMDVRVRGLEAWRTYVAGALALLGLMAPLFMVGIRHEIADLLKGVLG